MTPVQKDGVMGLVQALVNSHVRLASLRFLVGAISNAPGNLGLEHTLANEIAIEQAKCSRCANAVEREIDCLDYRKKEDVA